MYKIIPYLFVVLGTSTTALADPTTVAGTGNTTLPSTSSTVSTGSATLIATSNTATIAGSNDTGSLAKSNAPAPTSLTQYCPTPDQLVKDPTALTWSAPGGWQSYQQSFSTAIGQFSGVQWAGIKVGQVICTYKGTEKDSFPIQLVYNKLVFEPSGNSWGQNMGGYINCPSSSVNDCPFQVQLTQEVNVYKEAENIQRTVPQEQAF